MPPCRFCSFLNPACLKICKRLRRPLAGLAVQNDLVRRVKLVQALFDRAERDQLRAGNMADGVLIRLPNINQRELVAAVLLGFKLCRRDLFARRQRRAFVAAPDAAELVVVNQMRDGRMLAADRAVRVFADFEFPERHLERVEHQQAAQSASGLRSESA